MSFMEIYDPATGKRTRREFSGQSRWSSGKSREQGVQGASQGNRGWEAQYGAGDYAERLGTQANSLLNSITQKNNAPSLQPITHSLLSREGFNQALQNVQIHNLQKIAEQRRRALTNALGSVLRSGTALRTAGMNNATRERTAALDAATRKYGMDKNYDIRAKGLNEEQRYHDALIDYNKGLLDTQKGRLQLEAWKAKQPKQVNPMDAAIKRAKIVPDTSTFKALIPDPEVADEISDDNLKKARLYYIQTGKMPSFKKDEEHSHFWGDDYMPVQQAKSNGLAKPETPAAKIGPDHIAAIRDDIAKRFGISPGTVQYDPKTRKFLLPGEKEIALDGAFKIFSSYGSR